MEHLEFARFPNLGYAQREAINTLCTNLTFLGASKRKILVTSNHAAEGKSFLSMNIMRTMANLGKRVVLVDGDLRRSQINARHGVITQSENSFGVSHYLAGLCSLEQIVYETNIPGAYFVPVGHEVSNSLALLNTPRLQELLDVLADNFDYVLVDAPPLGAIIDAAAIAKYCDGTLLVVRYNSTSRQKLADTRDQLERSGCEILGVVLNDVDVNSLSAKKYYSKSYYSDYYSSDYNIDGKSKKRKSSASKKKAKVR